MTTSTLKKNLQPQAELEKVEACRRDVEARLESLQGRIESTVPFVTKNGVWAALALGVASGLALAYKARSRRRPA